MDSLYDKIEKAAAFAKALEAGGYNGAPDSLTQGSALQVEEMSNVAEVVTFKDDSFKLVKKVGIEKVKSVLVQFNRILAYGTNGGSATLEGGVGQFEDGTYVRVTVPMCFYSMLRKWTDVADMINTFDGKSAKERVAAEAALKLQSDIEFDSFRGMADFSNGGVYDGNPMVIAPLPNMYGLDVQIRQSDSERKARDLMFSEYGSDETNVIACGTNLTQEQIQDAQTRSELNWGVADELMVDPKVKAAFNKIALGYQRIMLGGSPVTGMGSTLDHQDGAQGTVKLTSSQWLRGKTGPSALRSNGPVATTIASVVSSTVAATPTTFVAAEVYQYKVTAGNELGESALSAAVTGTVVATGDILTVTVTASTGAKFYNIYRSAAGGAATSVKFIGRVRAASSGNTSFIDLNNQLPGFVNGYLCQWDTMTMKELAPFSRKELAQTDLSSTTAFFRFVSLALLAPRKNVILANLVG